MKPEQIIDAIGQLSDKTVCIRQRTVIWLRWVAAACAVLLVGIVVGRFLPIGRNVPGNVTILAEPIYQNEDRYSREDPLGDEYDTFVKQSTTAILEDSEGENSLYSPLNTYIALGLLAETTAGNSREQILHALDVPDIETLRTRSYRLWQRHYWEDDEKYTCIPANAVFLNENTQYITQAIQNIARYYYASVYKGTMGTTTYDKQIKDWINEQTRNLLESQTDTLQTDTQDRIILLSTLYYKAQWVKEFDKQENTTGVFHGSHGDTQVEYMHSTESMTYIETPTYMAVRKGVGNANIWFYLPHENTDLDTLLQDKTLLDPMLAQRDRNTQRMGANFELSIPKFDISTTTDMRGLANKLGINDIFSATQADFTPLGTKELAVTDFNHSVRISIDEEGCTGASYVYLGMEDSAIDPEKINSFVLDRPFLFVITSFEHIPLFVGVVQNP